MAPLAGPVLRFFHGFRVLFAFCYLGSGLEEDHNRKLTIGLVSRWNDPVRRARAHRTPLGRSLGLLGESPRGGTGVSRGSGQ